MLGLLEDLSQMTKGERLGRHLDTLVSLYLRIGHKQEADELMPKMLKLNPNAHDTRIKVIKEKASIPEQQQQAQTEYMRLEAALALKFQGESLTPEADENLKQEVEQLNFIIKANCGQKSLNDIVQFKLVGSNVYGSMGTGKQET